MQSFSSTIEHTTGGRTRVRIRKTTPALLLAFVMLLVSATTAACSNGDTAVVTEPPPPAPVASITVTPSTSSIDANGTVALTVTLRDAQQNVLAGRAVSFASNAPQIATVTANGVVTGVAAGLAHITVSSEGKAADAVITVRGVVSAIDIVTALDTLEAYDVRTVTAVVRDGNGQPIGAPDITWTSSNPAVASIGTHDGVLTGVDRGTVTITAQAGGKTATATRVVVIKYRSLALGTQHACDIASGGIAWCWGLNGTDARLGLDDVGAEVARTSPVRVPGGHRFSQLVTFARFTCGLRTDGKAFCWGNNSWGALGAGSNAGFSATPLAVAGNISFVSLSAGADHACGVTAANQTYCWGHNDWGQFGIGNTTSPATPVLAANGLTLKSIDAGPSFSCGIAMNNAAYCWGTNGLGQTGEGTAISYGNTFKNTPQPVAGNISFASLSLGYSFACGLATTGDAYCWGSNGGRLGDGTTTDASTPRLVSGGHRFVQLASGFGHSCAVTTANDLYCWGANDLGQLGTGGAFSRVPVLSAGGLKTAEVGVAGIGTGSGSFTCAISVDRLTTRCWGRNEYGQLGNGATSLPTTANPTPNIVIGQMPLVAAR